MSSPATFRREPRVTLVDGVFYNHGKRTSYRLTPWTGTSGRFFVSNATNGYENAFVPDEAAAAEAVARFIKAWDHDCG